VLLEWKSYDNNIGSFLNSIHAHVNLKYREVLNTYEDMYLIAFLDDMITWVFLKCKRHSGCRCLSKICLKIMAHYYKIVYIHHWELMKSVGKFMKKVMVWCFVSDCLQDTHEVMTALILVKSVLVLELTKGLPLKHCHGVLCHLLYDKSKIFWMRCLCAHYNLKELDAAG
jgi:hypothetical protein